jgi:ribosomal protein L7/L12
VNESLVWGILLVCVTAILLKRIGSLEARINAISRVEAKVDALLAHAGIRFDPYKEVPPAVVAAIERGKKIEAIKEYRVASGTDLKTAKEFVEELQRRRTIPV